MLLLVFYSMLWWAPRSTFTVVAWLTSHPLNRGVFLAIMSERSICMYTHIYTEKNWNKLEKLQPNTEMCKLWYLLQTTTKVTVGLYTKAQKPQHLPTVLICYMHHSIQQLVVKGAYMKWVLKGNFAKKIFFYIFFPMYKYACLYVY